MYDLMCGPEPSATIKDVCPRCSNGRPTCRDRKPDGTLHAHVETCATYEWADDVCGPCQADLALE